MTSRNANASRRLPQPSKQKPAAPARPSRRPNTPKKQGPSPAEALPKSPQQGPDNSHGTSQTEASGPPSASPTILPKPFDREKDKTITVKDAAFRLNKSEDTVCLWLRTGRLRGWQLGGNRCAVLVDAASVENALVCEMGTGGKVRTG